MIRKLFIIAAILCLTAPVFASNQRDNLVMQFGALQERERVLKEDLERIEYQKIKVLRQIKQLDSEKQTDEEKPADSKPAPADSSR